MLMDSANPDVQVGQRWMSVISGCLLTLGIQGTKSLQSFMTSTSMSVRCEQISLFTNTGAAGVQVCGTPEKTVYTFLEADESNK